jgi:two-component sensor histidine kinase
MPIDCTQHSDQFGGFFKSAAGGLIAGCPEHGVPLRQLLKIQLASFSEQVDIRGPEVVLHDASATCFATLINELAVNAAESGALSLPTGRVSLQWFTDEQSEPATLRFRWEETGGPNVVSPKQAGLGRTNIEALAIGFDKLRIDHCPGGLKCEAELPLGEAQQRKKSNEPV